MVLKEADKFHFSTTVFLSPYSEERCEEKEGVLMREDVFGILNCTSVHVELTDTSLISVQAKLQGHETIEHRLDFSRWFSFYQREDGLIRSVIHFAVVGHLCYNKPFCHQHYHYIQYLFQFCFLQ